MLTTDKMAMNIIIITVKKMICKSDTRGSSMFFNEPKTSLIQTI